MEIWEIIMGIAVVAYAVIEMRHGRATDQEIRDGLVHMDAQRQLDQHDAEQKHAQHVERIASLLATVQALDSEIDDAKIRLAVLEERTRKDRSEEDDSE